MASGWVDEEDPFLHRNNTDSFRRWALIDLPSWENASCRETDPELFFIDGHDGSKIPAAKKVCSECPVRQRCLEYALKWKVPFGIWGGTTPRERHYLRKSSVLVATKGNSNA